MEHVTVRCRGCGRLVRREPRVGERQQYCARSRCQRKRRARWQLERMRTDANYRSEQKAAQELARGQKTAYYRKYRAELKLQMKLSRRRQKQREQRRHLGKTPHRSAGSERPSAGSVAVGFPAGRYILQPLGGTVDRTTEVFLTPASPLVEVRATMDSIAASDGALRAENAGQQGGA